MENILLPQNNDEQTFTRTKVEQLFREFTRNLKIEEAERHEVQELSEDILEELDQSAKSTIQNNLKRFARETPKIKGRKWTTSETINKDFINDLKRHQVDSFQLINNKYRDAERVRLQARAAASIYDSLKRGFEEGGNEENFYDSLEHVRRLAVYGFATSKEMDHEDKTATLKALRLPERLKHLEEEEPGEKVFALDSETVEKIHKVRYEQSILRML
ncbi:hypothetical protein G6F60_011825 [Rhizopus arrhizus]|uniref:Uncharacterized protein n=1 Tax=Rhizopus oryzae TaxID=64495 RepID=A0A9P7BLB9_RHIOR|nr:hypothetical protein G6F24_013674 [Rhizopus arrhizus]KAG0898231.1 hypothetical protein G6F33_013354 [Rhizopus arrhizus]KAG1273903.1 hypothetical protein G6F66_013065 [Rhizopus arrhizus]KAG1299462.1 hypothetical protein G6F64_012843 [Rhizopus arrhizus]KAG1392864.1 hypothetical protein G6F60_011825 [Rhizopus arrhizus]